MASSIKNIIVFFLLIIIGGNVCSCKNMQSPQKGKIFINDIISGEYCLFKSYDGNNGNVELPFIAILKAYGFDVEWINDNHAKIVFKSKNYHLYLNSIEVIEEITGYDLIEPAPGSKRSYTIANKELYLDYINIMAFMNLIGENIKFDVNYDTLSVNVSF